MEKFVPDTSVIINGLFLSHLVSKNYSECEIILPQPVFDELQSQASRNSPEGFIGLEQITNIRILSNQKNYVFTTTGDHVTSDDVKFAKVGRIDSKIIDFAKEFQATLVTSDNLQNILATSKGVSSILLSPENLIQNPSFEKYFDSQTMSIHLKENEFPLAKRGFPGNFTLEKISEQKLTLENLKELVSDILDLCKNQKILPDLTKNGATVIQYLDYRIVITFPPFSENYEVTIVHPIKKMSLIDYSLPEKLMDRFSQRAEGIVISGAPGSGKSTLASGLANFYNSQQKIVKTFESPRDLQVDSGITQYSKLDGSFDNSADILLLVRPDYVIFDEVRRKEDFRTFADLRLTGVGMVGVIHANAPIDAIQRFIGKIELGMIPSILDTVVFVQGGEIKNVYELELKVKVPSGMTESDLARPVIEIRNFYDQNLEYEIYTFGEENVLIPVNKKNKNSVQKLAEDKISEFFKKFDSEAIVELLSENSVRVKVNSNVIPSIIGRGGSKINEIEKILKIHVDVVERETDSELINSNSLSFSFNESKTSFLIDVGRKYASQYAEIFVNGNLLSSERIGRKGQIKIPRRSQTGRDLMEFATSKNDIKIFLKDY